jgi:hypothetical protein
MSLTQNSLSTVDAAPGKGEAAQDHAAGQAGWADGERGTENAGALGGHTSLSSRPAPQGRRSLFRR